MTFIALDDEPIALAIIQKYAQDVPEAQLLATFTDARAAADFLQKMMDENYVERAHYGFFLCQQLQVTGYPTLFLQTDSLHFYLLSRGYSDFDSLKKRLTNALAEWEAQDK